MRRLSAGLLRFARNDDASGGYAATLVRGLRAGAAPASLPNDATMKSMNFLNLAGTWLRDA